MANPLTGSERRAFAIFWKWLTGEDLSDAGMEGKRNQDDPPDFWFSHDGIVIGMEHTHIRPMTPRLPPLQDQDIQRRICAHLEELLKGEQGAMPQVAISIIFASCHHVKKKAQEKATAERMLAAVRERLGVCKSDQIDFHVTDLADVDSCVAYAHVSVGGASSEVHGNPCGMVDEWGLPTFEAAAAEKANDLTNYKVKFDQHSLLLSTGGSHPALWVEPSPRACLTGIRSQFDRVFFADESTQRVYEIHVAK